MKSILLASTALVAAVGVHAAERPNILFICIDDLRTELGAYGSEDVITPNLDKLASKGRLFTHHYVQAPTSGVSRAMMLTGVAIRSQAATDNFFFSRKLVDSKECEAPETFVHHLRRNGYKTVGMGKVSHSDCGKTFSKGGRITPELPYSWSEFVNDPDSPWPNIFDGMLHGYENGQRRVKGNDPGFRFLDLADSCYVDGQLSSLAVAQLDKLAKSDSEEPFFMAVGFYKPHLPFVAPKRCWDLYEDVDIEPTATPEMPEGVDPVFVPQSNEFFSYLRPEKGGAGITLSDGYSKDVRRAYYSAISFTDSQVGRVIDKLKESGLAENTIIVVWGDHGWHLGDKSIWGKHTSFERALNSTFMVITPDMKRPGRSTDELIASIDIYPTICELAGIEVPKDIEGVSFVDQINSPTARSNREYVVSYWTNEMSVRNKRYRFAIHKDKNREAIMLFDHKKDPRETRNVAEQNPKVVEYFMDIVRRESRGFLY